MSITRCVACRAPCSCWLGWGGAAVVMSAHECWSIRHVLSLSLVSSTHNYSRQVELLEGDFDPEEYDRRG
jgi:hypothetical protein